MKKHFYYIVVLAFVTFSFNGCILDAFETLVQEIPYTITLGLSGNDTSIEKFENFNLEENDTYNENKDKLKEITFAHAVFRTNSVSPANLQGDITITLKTNNGVVLFNKVINDASPSAYLIEPYELPLSQAEIQAIDAFLVLPGNRNLEASVKVENLGAGQKQLNAIIDVVFEMEYELD